MTKDSKRMSKQEMIDTLKGIVFNSFHRTTAKEREALNAVIESLEQEPDWIPVSERLPTSDGSYIVTIYWFGSSDRAYVDTLDFKRDCGWYVYSPEYGNLEIDSVVAWMEKMAPYDKCLDSIDTYKVESEG